jgi:tRNA-dihydrouridine synthase B
LQGRTVLLFCPAQYPVFLMLQIAHLSFTSPFILAPLAGYTDLPFRLLCHRHGAGYCVSEMISCHGLVYNQPNTLKLLASIPEERPVAFQLFGADPEIMADAAEIMATYSPDMIDINMGCPVKKVTKRGAGAALMADLKLAERILKKIVARVSLPITVKIRSGENAHSVNASTFAEMAEATGVAAITVHARTWSQGFAGHIDPTVIADVKKRVNIPVIGNGDVITREDGLKMMAETGCDGIMVGRGALGNPWIFRGTGEPENLAERVAGAREHLKLIEELLPAERLLGHIKSQMSRYFKGLPGSSIVRRKVFSARNLKYLRMIIDSHACQA